MATSCQLSVEKSPSDELSLRNCAVISEADPLATQGVTYVQLQIFHFTQSLTRRKILKFTPFLSPSSLFFSLLFSSRSLLSYFSPSYPPFSPFSLPRYVKVLRPGHYYLTLAKDKRVKPGRIGLSGVQVNISVFVPSFLHPLSITLGNYK